MLALCQGESKGSDEGLRLRDVNFGFMPEKLSITIDNFTVNSQFKKFVYNHTWTFFSDKFLAFSGPHNKSRIENGKHVNF